MIDYSHPYADLLFKSPYQQCSNCIMDTTDPLIEFDADGICNHCKKYFNYIHSTSLQAPKAKRLESLVHLLKTEGDGKDYDCIMGLSGGVDSSYLAYYAVKVLGLRPLIVHVDTGWNSELAVSNIQNVVQKLHVDLHTLVIDWEEMKDLQLAFFRSSLANLDIPQDHSFIASLYQEAEKFGIKYILNGSNMATESILPNAWGYSASDSIHLKGVHALFGKKKLKAYPIVTPFQKYFLYPYIKGFKVVAPLEYIEYSKDSAKQLLINELGWKDYGGKHYESKFTKFFQAHYLPTKFGYDKRKAHLSSLVVSGQMSRENAIQELELELYNSKELNEDIVYFSKKLGISRQEYDEIMKLPPKTYDSYPNGEKLDERINGTIRFLSKTRNLLLGRR